jgi:putative acetyltransferase
MKKEEIRQFRAALREMSRELSMVNRRTTGPELSPLQSHILIELNNNPVGPSELAEKLCVDRATMSRTLRFLMECGYLMKKQVKSNGRSSTFLLTNTGKRLLYTLEEQADGFVEESLASSSDDELRYFYKAITSFSARLRNSRRLKDLGMVFRPIEPKDNTMIAELIQSTLQENEIDHPDGRSLQDPAFHRLSEVYNQPGAGYWVAEVNGRIVGGAGITSLTGINNICEIQRLYFDNDVTGLGMGKRMIRFIIKQATSMGYKSCYLGAKGAQKHDTRLYEAFGFEYVSERLGNSEHNSCSISMIKHL